MIRLTGIRQGERKSDFSTIDFESVFSDDVLLNESETKYFEVNLN